MVLTVIRMTTIPSTVSLACARTHSLQSPTQLVCLSQNTSVIFQAFACDGFFLLFAGKCLLILWGPTQMHFSSEIFPLSSMVVLIAVTGNYHKCSHFKKAPSSVGQKSSAVGLCWALCGESQDTDNGLCSLPEALGIDLSPDWFRLLTTVFSDCRTEIPAAFWPSARSQSLLLEAAPFLPTIYLHCPLSVENPLFFTANPWSLWSLLLPPLSLSHAPSWRIPYTLEGLCD